jgi:hypothetical protein
MAAEQELPILDGEVVDLDALLDPQPPQHLPAVVDGQVVRVIEIAPYPHAATALGGCTSFTGRYVTDPAEIAAIRLRVEKGRL